MDILIVMAVLLCALLLTVLLCAWFLRFEKKRVKKAEAANKKGIGFDERQIAAQRMASEFAMVVTSLYFLILYSLFNLWDLQNVEPVIKPATLIIGGLWLMVLSYNLYCLMTDSLVPMGNGSIPTVGSIVGGVVMILAVAIGTGFFRVPLMGEYSYRLDQLIMGVAFLSNGIINTIARSRSKRDTE